MGISQHASHQTPQASNDGRTNIIRMFDLLSFTVVKARTLSHLCHNVESHLHPVLLGTGIFPLTAVSGKEFLPPVSSDALQ